MSCYYSPVTHDASGNPLSSRDGMTMTWKNGRQLSTLQSGNNSISYSYDSNSVRVKKNVNGTEYTYAYVNGLLMYETRGTARFFYSYDSNGILYSVKYTLTDSSSPLTYYYTHNSRGDIVGIYNEAGELMAHYEYDAWGNVLSVTDQNGNAITSATHIGNLNPFRYRGYYLDMETGLYYLMSRYYDPVTHRFVNADGYFQSGGNILDTNMSAYCRNNPVNHTDCSGTHLDDEFIEKKKAKMKQSEMERQKKSTSTDEDSTPYSFFSAEYRIGEVPQISNNSPVGLYSKSGTYYINNYTSSSISVYASSDNEVGINFPSSSLFFSTDNLGIQINILSSNENSTSLEASFSLEDFCLRCGWDKTTYNGNGDFFENGCGIEINGLTIVAAALTIFGAMYGVPIEAY